MFIGGAVVQWLRDGLGLIKSSSEVEALAASVPDAGGVCLVPAFTGLGSPHWDPYARGAILGLSRGTTRAHVARAALESIAFQSAELLAAMQADARSPVRELRVDGGAARNDLLLQFQADLLGRAGGTSVEHRDHRAGRGEPRRSRRRPVAIDGRARRELARRPALRARDLPRCRSRAHGAAGRGPSNARAAGNASSRRRPWAVPSPSRRRSSSR